MEKTGSSVVNHTWKFFASVRLAVILLTLIALSAIIGTIIEQNVEPAKNMQMFIKLFGQYWAGPLFNISLKLGFMDMYNTWWFRTLLFLLSANITICTIERVPSIWRIIQRPLEPIKESKLRNLHLEHEVTIKGNLSRVKKEVENVLKKSSYNFKESKNEEGIQLYSQKGQYSRLGVYVIHTSMLLIFVARLIGSMFGFNGFIMLPERAERNTYYDFKKEKEMPLGFTIMCNDFDIDYYDNYMPKAYKSDLVLIDNGKEVAKKTIEVNHPLKYKGIVFYQSSYGKVQNPKESFVIKLKSAYGTEELYELKKGDTFTIPDTNLKGKIEDFSPALTWDEKSGRFFTFTDEIINPAILVTITEGDKIKYQGWIWKLYPQTGFLQGTGHQITFVDFKGFLYTGLQVRHDPGVLLFYLGCIVMTFGLFMAFFMSHKKIWVQLVEKKNTVSVLFFGITNKNQLAFERDIETLMNRFVQQAQGGR